MAIPFSSSDLARAEWMVDEAMRRRDMAAATRLADAAAKLGSERPQILVLASYDALNRGAAGSALDYAAKARALARRDPEVLNAYATALCRNGRIKEALPVYDAALRAAPDRVPLHFNKACALEDLGFMQRAFAGFERVTQLQPNHAGAWARMAYLAVMRGDGADARRFGERALQLSPGEQTAKLALLTADVDEKRFAPALAGAQALLADPATMGINRAMVEGLLADSLDGLGRYAEAFAAYVKGNETQRALYRGEFETDNGSAAAILVARLTAYFRDAPPQDWAAVKSSVPPKRTHVFLVGFPRSGTTLLEQVLASHPDVESMDERDCLFAAQNEFLRDADGLARLAKVSGAKLDPWRKAYWQAVGEQNIAPTKKVFVDKLPLHAVDLCLIAKLFPDAKILFALREPVDVVWSCFRRRFGMNAHMYELLSLEGAARHYDATMTLCEIYRGMLGLDIFDTVYERMVDDFEGQTRGLCAFLNLPWTDEMSRFAETARARAPYTPSGPQVAKGLYRTAVGQWQRYREFLAPVLPVLEPWCRRFGYR